MNIRKFLLRESINMQYNIPEHKSVWKQENSFYRETLCMWSMVHIDFLLVLFSLAFPILFFCGGESSYPFSGFFSYQPFILSRKDITKRYYNIFCTRKKIMISKKEGYNLRMKNSFKTRQFQKLLFTIVLIFLLSSLLSNKTFTLDWLLDEMISQVFFGLYNLIQILLYTHTHTSKCKYILYNSML